MTGPERRNATSEAHGYQQEGVAMTSPSQLRVHVAAIAFTLAIPAGLDTPPTST